MEKAMSIGIILLKISIAKNFIQKCLFSRPNFSDYLKLSALQSELENEAPGNDGKIYIDKAIH